ncbi:MAG: bifunctional D-glycero-beta-D-manno-heptose-7-phosphate kinase/D-glycero-beta-D-manno-heptose 1-phosphate adenylyltransferase HldE [Gammaproteobacteria bacterium]|nr:bifunctional D-glycero-beta-D-manno-heptose-7-phosphate kinase/D-glycero-beta-D-manno-heptose 1-phosphate adenylyltransferase HldE [Gammaproteobacteria bacterium]
MQALTAAKVLVVGDLMLDDYWEGDVLRISPEAPVPVVHIKKEFSKAGGAANVALNIHALEGQTYLLGLVGADLAAQKLESVLKEAQIKISLIVEKSHPTITKLRIISQNQQLIRADFEQSFESTDKAPLLDAFNQALSLVNVVILSDYGKGTLSEVQRLIQKARQEKKIVLVDPKSLDFSIYAGASVLTPNLKEFEQVVGVSHSDDEMAEKAMQLIQKNRLDALLVTRGPEGMSLFQESKKPIHIPTRAREVFDVSGAGDTVIAVLGMALSVGYPIETAVNLANSAAGVVVGKMGTATLNLAELHQSISENSQDLFEGVLDEKTLKRYVKDAQHKGEVVVMTNGCFDILHAGHVDYLTEARKLGDRLVIAVNSDESVSRLKGPHRPINNLADRMKILAALDGVDWVIPFSEETPECLIGEILPDILVKGADYEIHQIAGGKAVLKNGGQVKTIALTPDRSTTATIQKMQQGVCE